MSTTTHRSAGPRGSVSGVPTLPQVNLLPPEVRAARGLTATKRVLGLALVGILLLAGAGYGAARMTAASVDSELATAQSETVALQKDEAKYAEVPRVAGLLKRTTDARTVGMSTEIQWSGYIDAISAVLPPAVSISTLAVTQVTPSVAAPAPVDGLLPQGVATITFTATSTTLLDASAWVKALDSVPHFYGATFNSETLGDTNGVTAYSVTSSVQVNSGAYSNRFASKTAGK